MNEMKSIRIGGHIFQARAIGFDKDGTLFDAAAYWKYIDDLRLQELRKMTGTELVSQWQAEMGYKQPDNIDYQGVLATATTEEEIVLVAGMLYRELKWPWSRCRVTAADIFKNADRRMKAEEAFVPVRGFPDVIRMLKLHGIYVGILTSDSLLRTQKCMETYHVEDQLDFIVTPEKVKKGKPDPEMTLTACSALGISPSEMIVVGDSIVDIRMAKSAGSIAVGIITHEGSNEVLSGEADVLIESLTEIEVL